MFDGDGELVGTFPNYLAAHDWSVRRAAEGGARLPIEISTHHGDWAHQIYSDRCLSLHWPPPVVDLVVLRQPTGGRSRTRPYRIR